MANDSKNGSDGNHNSASDDETSSGEVSTLECEYIGDQYDSMNIGSK